jgi:hypothetical protein
MRARVSRSHHTVLAAHDTLARARSRVAASTAIDLPYGVPLGHAQQTVWIAGSDPAGDLVLPTQLNAWFPSAVPLRLALEWRSPYVFVGMAGQYAWTVPVTGPGAACSPCSGVGSDVVVGPTMDVHVLPGGAIDRWLGWDIGIESAQFDV